MFCGVITKLMDTAEFFLNVWKYDVIQVNVLAFFLQNDSCKKRPYLCGQCYTTYLCGLFYTTCMLAIMPITFSITFLLNEFMSDSIEIVRDYYVSIMTFLL